MSRFILVIGITILIQSISFAQNEYKHKTYHTEQIKKLHNGSLMVRLFTKDSLIAVLKKRGDDKLAEDVYNKQLKKNKMIINAFRTKYDFSKVYFFKSSSSVNIKNKDFDKVEFLNDEMQVDKSIKPLVDNFLIAEFGTSSGTNPKYGKEQTPGNEGLGFSGLFILNSDFIQLHSPFPYYVRTFEGSFIERNPYKVVSKMNKKLRKFYDKQIPTMTSSQNSQDHL